jgi:hypothetical protein
MAEFMNQNDVHQLSPFIHDCFLTRALVLGSAFNLDTDSDGIESGCLFHVDLQAVSWPASDVGDDFIRIPL